MSPLVKLEKCISACKSLLALLALTQIHKTHAFEKYFKLLKLFNVILFLIFAIIYSVIFRRQIKREKNAASNENIGLHFRQKFDIKVI